MTVTQVSNYLNQIVQLHKAQSFSYPSLQYYLIGPDSEFQGGARQNNSNPTGAVGRQYPFLLCSHPDANVAAVRQGGKISYELDLYFYDLKGYGTTGTQNNRSVVEIQRDLIYISRDVIFALAKIGQTVAPDYRFQVVQTTNDQRYRAEFVNTTAVENACSLRCSITIETTIPCTAFVFDPLALPTEVQPYPAADNDYEKNVS